MSWLRMFVLLGAVALAVGACSTKPSATGRTGTVFGGPYVGVGAGVGF
jgi:hypothetical protein